MHKIVHIILLILLLPIESVMMSPFRPDIGNSCFLLFYSFCSVLLEVYQFYSFFSKELAFGFFFFFYFPIFYSLGSCFDLYYSFLLLILGLICSFWFTKFETKVIGDFSSFLI